MRNNLLSMRLQRLTTSLAAAVFCMAGGMLNAHAADADPATGTVAVQTVPAQRGPIAQPVRAYGIVSASGASVTTVTLPYGTHIARLLVQAGQTVKRGAPLSTVTADPSAVLAASQAKSALAFAQSELSRTQSLFDNALATASQLSAAKKGVADARDALDAQRRMGVGAGITTIYAPIGGVVLQVSVSQGDQVPAGAAIMQIAQTDIGTASHANVMLSVEPDDVATVHAGDTVTVHGLSSALSQAAISGRVTVVGAALDSQSQLVDVGATVPLRGTPFMPGTHVSADIATQAGTHWIVPRSCVLTDDQGAYLFQVAPNQKAKRVSVRIAVEDGQRYGVDGALDAALPVVAMGNYELKDGMSVRRAGGAAR
ncbi:efflux RND transporter periplasmic adaptor subunit [Trinickia sp. Y13]|uniref:efflux RND transporter periplasmic adaptor subunit n=1 Tax=Trinickia sp. Y13 TaxID=2917807 RepID=UPI002406A329|nr:efflux RND transporter periplasmic adaptor subunit [Trinickia sp. Y13]MDG0023384.1 efflux RND transporter periplasmic adaptor subunit [Trinickia sp. Y13]